MNLKFSFSNIPFSKKWSLDESIDWTKINVHAAEFILSQAEKLLAERNETAKRTTERGYTLLGILIPVITIMIGVFCSSLSVEKEKINIIIVQNSGLAILFLLLSMFVLIYLILPYNYMCMGREPKHLATKDFLTEKSFQHLALLLTEIEDIQMRISKTECYNTVRLRLLNISLIIILIGIVLTMSSLFQTFYPILTTLFE